MRRLGSSITARPAERRPDHGKSRSLELLPLEQDDSSPRATNWLSLMYVFLPDTYQLPGSGAFSLALNYSCQILSRAQIENWTATTGLRIADEELWNCFTGEYWTLGKRPQPPTLSCPSKQHHVICLCLETS